MLLRQQHCHIAMTVPSSIPSSPNNIWVLQLFQQRDLAYGVAGHTLQERKGDRESRERQDRV